MYIENWDEFEKAAEELYIANPERTRYVHSFRRKDGDLVLKVTDDLNCVQYKTNQMADLKKFISLNNTLMLKMMKKEIDTMIPDAPPATAENKTASPKQTPKGKKGRKRK
ncbi:signal recognition particle 9 kDa protein [Cokeromyces recurvatus]|uniref:signal recognition particle 9 kDa protein n=1 Tax=Cokeromyces recurvatus TaxID=90255 RepID=UPI002220CF31|nr:signal recognition particle 9 kDa protein [Cokeromyces recurvatus]KAI7904049.1 signal recognition particle 9 kDa protein [Cokeromyces recurvatus]